MENGKVTPKQEKRNLIAFPLATLGRDMCSQFFTYAIMNFILFTKNLTVQQFSVISIIIVAARVFDALNDPLMGTLLDRTRTKIGKFKPWMIAGVITTSIVVLAAFLNNFTGWNFVVFFGFIYFFYSICFTMNDVSYWGMIPALSSKPEMRDKFTSLTVFWSGAGAGFVSVLVPVFTAGGMVIGGNAVTAYRTLACIACVAPVTMLLVFLLVKENREENTQNKEKVSLKTIFGTIVRNDQLKWAALVFLIHQIGCLIITNGLASTYIYLEFGYKGILSTLFTVISMSTTVILMLIYPQLAKKFSRNKLINISKYAAVVGYLFVLVCGLLAPQGTMLKYGLIVAGFAIANSGTYCIYLAMMICLSNTVEYNEYKFGERNEGIIASVRPFLSKLSNAISVMLVSFFYIITGVTVYTNQISDLENQTSQGLISEQEKLSAIGTLLENVSSHETVGLLLAMAIIPLVTVVIAATVYKKKYKIDEKMYLEMVETIEQNKIKNIPEKV